MYTYFEVILVYFPLFGLVLGKNLATLREPHSDGITKL
jgi:hypothetical protein